MIINNIPHRGAGGSGVNKNLLDNWYFGNPVNRRGGFCFITKGTPCYSDTALTTPEGNVCLETFPVTVENDTYSSFISNSGATWYMSTADVKHGYNGVTTYPWSIDRWIARGSMVSILDNGVEISTAGQDINNAGFQSTIENPEGLVGKEVTLSFLITENNATDIIRFGIFYGAGAVNMTSWAIGYADIPVGATGLFSITGTLPDMEDYKAMNPSIRMQGTQNGDFTLLGAKLELGDTQTLAYQDDSGNWQLYEIPNYEEEYAKCVAIEPKVNNDNLLMNWYFKNPVNRKNGYYVPIGTKYYTDSALTTAGSAVTTGTVIAATVVNSTYSYYTVSGTNYYVSTADVRKGYVTGGNTIDCWWNRVNNAGDATAALLTEDGLRYEVIKTSTSSTFNRFLNQRIEDYKNLLGKQVTLSYLVRDCFSDVTSNFFGVGMHSSARIDYNSTNLGNVWKNKTGLFSVTLTVPEVINSSHNGLNVFIAILSGANTVSVGDYVTIEAVKLELGDKQTLAHQDKDGNWVLNEIPDYEEMYEQCSKYPVEHEDTYTGNEGFIPLSGQVTMTGKLMANEDTDYNIYRVRNIAAGTTAMTAGSSTLASGAIYFQYE